jgi:hypothetical protein
MGSLSVIPFPIKILGAHLLILQFKPNQSSLKVPVTLLSDSWSCPSLTGLSEHTHWTHHTFGRIPLDELSARRRDLHLTTHNTYNRQTSMNADRFEPTFPKCERP